MLVGFVSDERYSALADVLLEFVNASGESWEARSRATGAVHCDCPPGEYEVYSESETGVFTYQRLSLSSDMTLSLIPAEPNTVTVTGGPRIGLRRRSSSVCRS